MSSTMLWAKQSALASRTPNTLSAVIYPNGLRFEQNNAYGHDLYGHTLVDSIALVNPAAFEDLPICKVTVRESIPANPDSLRGIFQLGQATAEVELGYVVGHDDHNISQDIEIVSANLADAKALYLAIKTGQMDGVTVVHRYQHPTPPAPAEDHQD